MTYEWKEGKWPRQKFQWFVAISRKVQIELWKIPGGWECKVRYDFRVVDSQSWKLETDTGLQYCQIKSVELYKKVRDSFNGV